jgi:hypothetical protein
MEKVYYTHQAIDGRVYEVAPYDPLVHINSLAEWLKARPEIDYVVEEHDERTLGLDHPILGLIAWTRFLEWRDAK